MSFADHMYLPIPTWGFFLERDYQLSGMMIIKIGWFTVNSMSNNHDLNVLDYAVAVWDLGYVCLFMMKIPLLYQWVGVELACFGLNGTRHHGGSSRGQLSHMCMRE